jgi:hypothetical protein
MRNCNVRNWDTGNPEKPKSNKNKHMVGELNINTSLLEEREFLNIKDLKETLGTSQNTIYRICNRKELNKYKFRGKCWFRSDEVKTYLIGKGILK